MIRDIYSYRGLIKGKLHSHISSGKKKFVIYPYGDIGKLVRGILHQEFGIEEAYIVDNGLENHNNIVKVDDIPYQDNQDVYFLICSDNPYYYREIRQSIKLYAEEKYIIDLFQKEEEIGKQEIDQTLKKLDQYLESVKND